MNLLNENRGILLKVCRIYMDNPTDQEDLEQEIVFQLWKSYDRFNGESKFSTWMYRVALNTAITFFKKDKKRVDRHTISTDLDVQAEAASGVEEDRLAHFYRAVKSLNKIEKALILLFIEGLSHNEIGKNLGLSEGNARVKLTRTKKKLQAIIKAQGYEF